LPSLDIKDAVTIVTGIITLSGVIWSMRAAVAKLETGQAEVLRQLGALHKRLDDTNKRVSKNELLTARLEERVDLTWPGPNRSQRFRLPDAED
jgi:hypothetical protein